MHREEWVEIARRGRNHAVLLPDSVAYAYLAGYPKKEFGLPYVPDSYRQFEGARWLKQSTFEKFKQAMRGMEERTPGALLKLAYRQEKGVWKTRRVADELARKDWKGVSNAVLIKGFRKFLNAYYLICGPAYNYIVLNRFYAESLIETIMRKIPDIHEQTRAQAVLFGIEKDIGTRKEKEGLLKIVGELKTGKLRLGRGQFNRKVEKHCEKFAHLGIYVFYGKAYSPSIIRKRISHLLGKDYNKELASLREQKEYGKNTRKYIRKLRLAKEEILQIRTIKEWNYLSTIADETFGYIAYKSRPLFEEIAKRLGIKYGDVIEMRALEIIGALDKNRKLGSEFVKELKERYEDHAYILEGGKIRLLVGAELKKYYGRELPEQEALHKLLEVKGQPASAGHAKGKVALLLSIHELHKVKKGNILVAASTMPAFVPAMEKAAAIVTNEGGLLSHAAIVSRELGIPCVVGTKIATKVFRDGQLVEVDAVKGIVKKISK